jgi:hypothetical protein
LATQTPHGLVFQLSPACTHWRDHPLRFLNRIRIDKLGRTSVAKDLMLHRKASLHQNPPRQRILNASPSHFPNFAAEF